MQMRRVLALAALLAAAGAAGCKGSDHGPGLDTAASASSASPSAAAGGEQTPDAGGQVITVQMITDEKSSRFEPAEIPAKRGDVIRYTLGVGVHNVHFLADSNAGRSGYPAAASDLLQLPGQTYDVKVTFPSGKYYFQCDPHAALGMVGHVNVQ